MGRQQRTRLSLLKPLVAAVDGQTVPVGPKTVDPFYASPEHRQWRDLVVQRAGGRCEWIENGIRCERAEPQHRMFADHIRERTDGGRPFDPANGQCLCGRHHSLKTAAERRKRFRTA